MFELTYGNATKNETAIFQTFLLTLMTRRPPVNLARAISVEQGGRNQTEQLERWMKSEEAAIANISKSCEGI